MIQKLAVGYVRISQKDRTLSKVELETSITNQENEIKQYCKKEKHELIKIYREKYITGDDPTRPIFNEMIRDAKKKQFDILVVRSLSRLTREGSEAQEDYMTYFNYYSIEVKSLTENIDNELNRFIYGFIHKIPIILGRINTKHMRKGKKQDGRAYIKAPYGYVNLKKRKRYWKVNNKEAEIVRNVFEMKIRGMSYKAIVISVEITNELYYKILKTRSYVGVKVKDNFKSIISHKSYIKDSKKKIIDIKQEEYFGFHEPLVSPQDWLKVNPEDKDNVCIKELL